MKAYEIIKTDRYWDSQQFIFKHYANALDFRIRQRAIDMQKWHSENRFWKSYFASKLSKIKEIEVADDYRKKDFWWWVRLSLTSDWFKSEWYKKNTEEEFLSWQLYFIHKNIKSSTFDKWWLDANAEDVKNILEQLKWYTETSLPKNRRLEQERILFFECWKILKKYWKEYFIQERTRWMYEEDFEEYLNE